MRRHYSVHQKGASFRCSICEKELSRADALVRHVRTAHGSQQSGEAEKVATSSSAAAAESSALIHGMQAKEVDDVDQLPLIESSVHTANESSNGGSHQGEPSDAWHESHVTQFVPPRCPNIAPSHISGNTAGELETAANAPAFWTTPDLNISDQRNVDSQFDTFFSMLAGFGNSSGNGGYPGTSHRTNMFSHVQDTSTAQSSGAPIETIFGSSESDYAGHWFDEYLLPIPDDVELVNNTLDLYASETNKANAQKNWNSTISGAPDGDDWSLPPSTSFVTKDGVPKLQNSFTAVSNAASPTDVLRQLNIAVVGYEYLMHFLSVYI